MLCAVIGIVSEAGGLVLLEVVAWLEVGDVLLDVAGRAAVCGERCIFSLDILA